MSYYDEYGDFEFYDLVYRPTYSSDPPSTSSSATDLQSNPTEYQAIVFEGFKGFDIKHYTKALCTKISPKEILYVSQKPSGHICFYLSSAELAKEVVTKKKKIVLRNDQRAVEVQPELLRKVLRVTIHNLSPEIPSSFIMKEVLLPRHISPRSEITPMQAELSEPGCEHILSFKRRFDIDPKDKTNVPYSLIIKIRDSKENVSFTVEEYE